MKKVMLEMRRSQVMQEMQVSLLHLRVDLLKDEPLCLQRKYGSQRAGEKRCGVLNKYPTSDQFGFTEPWVESHLGYVSASSMHAHFVRFVSV